MKFHDKVHRIYTMEDGNLNVVFYNDDPVTNRKKLFEDALVFAKQGKVLYILHEELKELPKLSKDLNQVTKQYMKMISFLYAQTLESLIASLSTLPDWQSIPSLIILDDLTSYSKNNAQITSGVVALILDTAKSCNSALNGPCLVRISVTKENLNGDLCNMLRELYCKQNK